MSEITTKLPKTVVSEFFQNNTQAIPLYKISAWSEKTLGNGKTPKLEWSKQILALVSEELLTSVFRSDILTIDYEAPSITTEGSDLHILEKIKSFIDLKVFSIEESYSNNKPHEAWGHADPAYWKYKEVTLLKVT